MQNNPAIAAIIEENERLRRWLDVFAQWSDPADMQTTGVMHTLYKLENTKARLCAGRTETSDPDVAKMVRALWEAQGYIVTEETDY